LFYSDYFNCFIGVSCVFRKRLLQKEYKDQYMGISFFEPAKGGYIESRRDCINRKESVNEI
jgi:hypothetical protein